PPDVHPPPPAPSLPAALGRRGRRFVAGGRSTVREGRTCVIHRGPSVKPPKPLVSRRKGSRFANALLGWELLRVSRRTGALAIGRFAFGAALLGVMWILWRAEYSETLEIAKGGINKIAND